MSRGLTVVDGRIEFGGLVSVKEGQHLSDPPHPVPLPPGARGPAKLIGASCVTYEGLEFMGQRYLAFLRAIAAVAKAPFQETTRFLGHKSRPLGWAAPKKQRHRVATITCYRGREATRGAGKIGCCYKNTRRRRRINVQAIPLVLTHPESKLSGPPGNTRDDP